MATLQDATTSTGAIVSDPQAVRELCESYCFGTLDWEVTDECELINHKPPRPPDSTTQIRSGLRQ
ncbi:hypothetical protein DVK06_16145 [Halorubrum sp. Atlit-28R]|nr:hypothetical protein DVK06_16145 [Halorubrum sp. Atlit-28R]